MLANRKSKGGSCNLHATNCIQIESERKAQPRGHCREERGFSEGEKGEEEAKKNPGIRKRSEAVGSTSAMTAAAVAASQ